VTRTAAGVPLITTAGHGAGECIGGVSNSVAGDGPVFLRVEGDALIAPFDGAMHVDDARAVRQIIMSIDGAANEPVLVRWLMPDREQRFLELVFLPGSTGATKDIVVHGWEVTAHVRNMQALEHLALHDPLTGLANRVLFEERVRDELRRRGRTGRAVAVVYADLDGFKEINDTWGHAAGDILLTTLADRLRDCVRPGDVVARLGGDEFAICCPDLAGAEDALAVAHRLIDDATAPVAVGSTLVRVSVAVGVALADDDEPEDGAQLIARADFAMYAAKSTGRARVALAPSGERDQAVC
jgi:diguanylate cyclase (GGDEF)-like protein